MYMMCTAISNNNDFILYSRELRRQKLLSRTIVLRRYMIMQTACSALVVFVLLGLGTLTFDVGISTYGTRLRLVSVTRYTSSPVDIVCGVA